MKTLVTTFLFVITTIVYSQDPGDHIFDNEYIHEVKINFDNPDIWPILEQNYFLSWGGEEIPDEIASVTIDGVFVDSIGVRLKGYTSFFTTNTVKKPIKLDFNSFVPGKRYDGLRKLNLNNGLADPAMQRDFLAYEMLNKSGVSAARTAYTKVYINDEYWGVYMLVEQIDKEFLKRNFHNGSGNLFKNVEWSDHEWLGDDPSMYSPPFDLKTNEDENDWSGFVEFTRILNLTFGEEFKTEFPKVFDIDRYLRTLVVDVATNNWDSYLEHGRNWYVYEDNDVNTFQWVPWDYNLSMGGQLEFGGAQGCTPSDPTTCFSYQDGSMPHEPTDSILKIVLEYDCYCCNNPWDETCNDYYNGVESGENIENIQNWNYDFPLDLVPQNQRTIIKKLLQVPEYRQKYYAFFCYYLENIFTYENVTKTIDHNVELLKEIFAEEPYALYSLEKFLWDSSYENEDRGIKKLLRERIDNLNTQLSSVNFDCPSQQLLSYKNVIINEIMADNDSLSIIQDQNGENDDWIELFNPTDEIIFLDGNYLSDLKSNPMKWKIPSGTYILPNDYLIIWADKDEDQLGYHTSFSLDKNGETLLLTNFNGDIIDSVSYSMQETNKGFARVPNGTGSFVIQEATFGASNGTSSTDFTTMDMEITLFPNPANEVLYIKIGDESGTNYRLQVNNTMGQSIQSFNTNQSRITFNTQTLQPGVYVLTIFNEEGFKATESFIVQR